eukprot:TRINITY_DN4002_c0_g2_i1.p1 TRINITY_DN4002_c0_g2~~TRINITY_DN4002_c0_g2_i1.p1  ORF type:complete len:161 (-),score=15.14 TRINITY_DN4002_c0_g2_i1:149-631(-)
MMQGLRGGGKTALCLGVLLVLMLVAYVHAGCSIAVELKLSDVAFQNRASNHRTYQSLLFSGHLSISDCVPINLPPVLPQQLALLFPRELPQTPDQNLLTLCDSYARASYGLTFRVDIFMDNVTQFVDFIEGGMADNRFNSFVIPLDDERIDNVRCNVALH